MSEVANQRNKRKRFYYDDEEDFEAVLRKEKRFMVLIGYDKKACFVDTECSKTFPKREGILSIEERYNLRTNDELYIYWNNGKVREQIKAVFKSFASSQTSAIDMVKSLSRKLVSSSGSTISGATDVIIRNVDLDSSVASLSPDEELMNDVGSPHAVNFYKEKFDEKLLAAAQLKATALNANRNFAKDNRNNSLTESFCNDFSVHTKNVEKWFCEMRDNMKMLNDNVDKIRNQVGDQAMSISKIRRSVAPTKLELNEIENYEYGPLVEEADENVQWLEAKISLSPVVNDIYQMYGRKPVDFIRNLACKIYGDLLAVYKFRVLRVYADTSRKNKTRSPLNELDPIGCGIIKYLLNLYYDRHKQLIQDSETKIKLTRDQFHNYAAEVIDAFGSQANANGGRRKVFVEDTLFYTYVIERKLKPTSKFNDEIYIEIKNLLNQFRVPRSTNKQHRRLKIDNQPTTQSLSFLDNDVRLN